MESGITACLHGSGAVQYLKRRVEEENQGNAGVLLENAEHRSDNIPVRFRSS